MNKLLTKLLYFLEHTRNSCHPWSVIITNILLNHLEDVFKKLVHVLTCNHCNIISEKYLSKKADT